MVLRRWTISKAGRLTRKLPMANAVTINSAVFAGTYPVVVLKVGCLGIYEYELAMTPTEAGEIVRQLSNRLYFLAKEGEKVTP